MKSVLKSNYFFLIPYSIFIFIGAGLLYINSKSELHIAFNGFHNRFFDQFFFYFTYLGDGIMSLLTVIILLSVKYRFALIVGLSNVISALFTQLLKRTVFYDSPRPKKFFEGVHDLHFIPDVHNHLNFSFPSGHATSAFTLYFSLALIIPGKKLKLLLFLIALLAAYSRVYLSQHFFEDIYVGSIIGTVITFITYLYIKNIQSVKLDKSVVSLFR